MQISAHTKSISTVSIKMRNPISRLVQLVLLLSTVTNISLSLAQDNCDKGNVNVYCTSNTVVSSTEENVVQKCASSVAELLLENESSNTHTKAWLPNCMSKEFNLTLANNGKHVAKTITRAVYPKVKASLDNLVTHISNSWIDKIASVNNIFDRQDVVDNLTSLASSVISDAQNSLESSTTLSQYIDVIYSIINNNAPSIKRSGQILYDHIKTTSEYVDYLLSVDNSVSWKANDWDVFSILSGVLNSEADFIKIMEHLFQQLRSYNIAINDSGSYKDWYYTNRFSLSMATFDTFWNKFSTLLSPITTKAQLQTAMSLNPTAKFATLGSLLVTTVGTPSFKCQYVNAGVVVYESNYVNFDKIFSSACANTNMNINTIVVLALDTAFIDRSVTSTAFVGNRALNIVVISPRISVEKANAAITLRGYSPPQASTTPPACCGSTAGRAGDNGSPGGDFYAFTKDMGSQYRLSVDCSGGHGTNGQVGQTGIAGAKGSTQTVRHQNNNDCAAWSGGWINVRVYPNSCNVGSGQCHAGNSGVNVYVYGTAGKAGSRGGTGGAGGTGGLAGVCSVTCSTCSGKYTVTANRGVTGNKGSDGPTGANGNCGDTNYYNIDDKVSGGEKKCYVVYKGTYTNTANYPCRATRSIENNEYNDTKSYTNGTVVHSELQQDQYEISSSEKANLSAISITQYKQRFITLAQQNYNNEFIGQKLRDLVTSL